MEYLLIRLEGAYLFNDNFELKKKKLAEGLSKEEAIKAVNAKDALILNEISHYLLFPKECPAEQKDTLKNLKYILEKCTEAIEVKQKKYIELSQKQVRESVDDNNLIIQTFNNIDEMKKTFNLFSKRLREYFELTAPEVSRKINDHAKLADLVANNTKAELEKKYGVKVSAGAELAKVDYATIQSMAKLNLAMAKEIEDRESYLEEKLMEFAPNLTTLAGSNIGAQLIAHVGSLKKLSQIPASTLQVLGAEKSMFRFLKGAGRCPKYGYLFNHQIVQRSKNKGKLARQLACKLSLCAKVDVNGGKLIAKKFLTTLKNEK